MRLAELRIFLFDLGEAISPSRPQFNCAAVSSVRLRMAAAWRPPEGLVLDGREHGGRLCHAGGEGDHHRRGLPAPLPMSPTAFGKRKREGHQKPWYAVHSIPRCMRSPLLCEVCLRETGERVCRPLSCFNIL